MFAIDNNKYILVLHNSLHRNKVGITFIMYNIMPVLLLETTSLKCKRQARAPWLKPHKEVRIVLHCLIPRINAVQLVPYADLGAPYLDQLKLNAEWIAD